MEGDTDSFILRIWREAVDSTGNVIAWKGSIEHVGSEQYLYFQDLEVMARFVQEQCRLPFRQTNNPGPTGWAATQEG